MFELDELKIYRGDGIVVNKNITITIPTIEQIADFGEQTYFNAVQTFTAVGADLKWQLWDMGVDYTQIEDYELFVRLISQLIGSRKELYHDRIEHPEKYEDTLDEADMQRLLINPMQLLFKDFDFSELKAYQMQNGQLILYNPEKDFTFDRMIYSVCVDIIRKLHGFERNNQMPANERTKMDLIEDARDEAMASKYKQFKSVLKPLISTLQVSSGQCGDQRIWEMPISAFFDNVRRIGKIQDARLLLQGAYSGFANLKGVDKDRLDMFGEL